MVIDSSEVAAAVADAHRSHWGFALAATVRVTRDLDVAEECVQDAYAHALTAWAAHGIPDDPCAWLTTVARRRAIDGVRRKQTLRDKLPLLTVEPLEEPTPEQLAVSRRTADEIADDRLRLIFTCCHPALNVEAQVALTLRLLCGLSTADVAHAFLVGAATMAARITRAKKKIAATHIPYRVPTSAELPARVDSVLTVIHLMFSTGHTAPAGPNLMRRELSERALDLARMLHHLLPNDPHVVGLLALILLTDARRDTRLTAQGHLALLADQDRSRWDHDEITEGLDLARMALRHRPPGRFSLMAAITAVHAQAPDYNHTDWTEIVGLYDLLAAMWPSPVVALNRAIAIGEAHGPAAGLRALDALATEPQLSGYQYLPAARAELLRRMHRDSDARLAYQEALLMTDNDVERDHLAARLHTLGRD